MQALSTSSAFLPGNHPDGWRGCSFFVSTPSLSLSGEPLLALVFAFPMNVVLTFSVRGDDELDRMSSDIAGDESLADFPMNVVLTFSVRGDDELDRMSSVIAGEESLADFPMVWIVFTM